MKLIKSSVDKYVSGVCSGIAKYLGWPPFLVRSLLVIVTISTGFIPCVIGYFLLAMFMPEDYYDL